MANIIELLHQKYCDFVEQFVRLEPITELPELPVPVVSVGHTKVHQHKMTDAIGSVPVILGDSRSVNIGISFRPKSTLSDWLIKNPLIIMEVKSNKRGKGRTGKWIHPANHPIPLRRDDTNYGGGTPIPGMITEWEIGHGEYFKETIISINPSLFYRKNAGNTINLPIKKSDAITGNLIRSRFVKSSIKIQGSKTSNFWRNVIRFRFAYFEISGGLMKMYIGEPSDEIVIEPKIGLFSDDDNWIYDYSVRIV